MENLYINKIHKLCNQYGIENYSIIEDGSINVGGDVQLSKIHLKEIPIKFNRIDGFFMCQFNKLTKLENCPRYITKYFSCQKNNLQTLIGGPEYVGGAYYCRCNNLKDVYGFPEIFKKELIISENPVCEILDLVEENKLIKFINYLNNNNVIRNGNIVIQARLEETFYEIKIKYPNSINFKNYKVI